MRKKNEIKLGDGLKAFLKESGLEDKLLKTELIVNWDRVMGPAVANKTDKVEFKRGTLYVQLKSSVLRQELQWHKTKIIEAMNESVQKPGTVKDIRFV
ncbi:MAG: DUF721 domain-containing protein [Schleiferiaceae bacterium]|jgi:hypothetical protein